MFSTVLLPRLLHPFQQLRAPRLFDVSFFRLVVQPGMEETAALGLGLRFLDLDAVFVGPGVLTNAGHLPGDLDARLVGLDGEAMVRDLVAHERKLRLSAAKYSGSVTVASPLPVDDQACPVTPSGRAVVPTRSASLSRRAYADA